MPTLLEICQLGNPKIREAAKQVDDVSNRLIQTLIDDMIHTCATSDGVGIAAPQVGHSLRVFILASKPNDRYPDAPNMEPMAIINPIVHAFSPEMVDGWEGCLSVPGIRGIVSRHRSLTASFTNRFGKPEGIECVGFVARVFQHELDHLDGIVFLDRADSRSLATDKEYQRILHDSTQK